MAGACPFVGPASLALAFYLTTSTCYVGWLPLNSPLKNAVVAFFNLAGARSKAPHGSQNNDLRRYFGITSM